MRRFRIIAWTVLAGGLVAGAAFLVTWDIPPPTQQVEKVIPDDRFSP